ncbi:MAG: hypothetical protein WKF46_07445 [Candidatus Limnocylindrales bacterium]
MNHEPLIASPFPVTNTNESPNGTKGRSAAWRTQWARSRSTMKGGSGMVAAEAAVFVSTLAALRPDPEI